MSATPTTEQRDDLQAMVGPGQDDIFDQFLQEVEQQQNEIAAAEQASQQGEEQQLLAGKFKSPEELEKAYKELESKLGQRSQQPPEPEAKPLSRDEAIGQYGESIVTAAEEAGIDLGAWDQAVRRGEDTAELRQKLATQTGIPAQLIEQYEAAFRPQANPPAKPDGSSPGLTDADVSELKALVGGEQEFARLSQWAVANMGADELADYNAAVDSGNKAAVRLALRAMQARATAQNPGEPELIGGGRPAKVEVFESQQQAIEAMRKTNSQGQNLYRTDAKYREWFDRTMARSTFDL